jgi:cytochrome c oxidase assembly protein subunit 15
MDNLTSMNPRAGRTLAIGFGTTVAMWAVAYVSMMQPGMVVGELLFGLILACLVSGGAVAGQNLRPGESGVRSGAKVGATSAILNMLLIGSLLGGKTSSDKLLNAIIWIAGLFAASMMLAMAGAVIGTTTAQNVRERQRNWIYLFMCVAVATVFLLLITGGLVTGLKAGLAVPDWPNSFGHNMLLYPLSEMVGGIYYEHAHRLYGMLVGVTAITVVGVMLLYESRRWMRGLAVAYLLAVCVQGVLGGTRVTETSTVLAIAHGVFAQIVFAAVACIAAMTSTTWRAAQPTLTLRKADLIAPLILTLLLLIQLTLGAMYRHLHRAAENPPHPLHPLYTHIGLAVIITIVIIFVAGRAWGGHRDLPVLPAIGRTLIGLVLFQLMLGMSAMVVVWMSDPGHIRAYEVIVTTAHQITGAMLLAGSALLALWSRRLLSLSQT